MMAGIGDQPLGGDAEVLERMARAQAARADRPTSAHPAIVALMAGAGARLVADQNKARTILAERVRQAAARRAGKPARFGEPAGGDSPPRNQQAGGRHRRCAPTQAGDPW